MNNKRKREKKFHEVMHVKCTFFFICNFVATLLRLSTRNHRNKRKEKSLVPGNGNCNEKNKCNSWWLACLIMQIYVPCEFPGVDLFYLLRRSVGCTQVARSFSWLRSCSRLWSHSLIWELRRRQQNARLLKSQQKRIMSLNLFYDAIVNNKFMSLLNNRLASHLDTLECSGLYALHSAVLFFGTLFVFSLAIYFLSQNALFFDVWTRRLVRIMEVRLMWLFSRCNQCNIIFPALIITQELEGQVTTCARSKAATRCLIFCSIAQLHFAFFVQEVDGEKETHNVKRTAENCSFTYK